jgi:hypothetical protein
VSEVNLIHQIQLYGALSRNAEYWRIRAWHIQNVERIEEFQRNREQSEKRAEEIFAEIKKQVEGNDENNKR